VIDGRRVVVHLGKKANRQWVWIAQDATTRQVLAFSVGDRRVQRAQALWEKIPTVYRQHAVFSTDHYAAYTRVSFPAPNTVFPAFSPVS
jgi:insertion element IS1 protein InsB